jgi:exoribonuclease R
MIDPSFVMEKISLNYGNEHRPSLTIQMHFDNRMDISECEIFESLFKSN